MLEYVMVDKQRSYRNCIKEELDHWRQAWQSSTINSFAKW